MSKPPEYISPWGNQQPSDVPQRVRAARAFASLHSRFFPPETVGNAEATLAATRRLNHVLERYTALTIQAASEGMDKAGRAAFVKEGLKTDALIDPSDEAKASEDFQIISEGYELNRPYWDEKLGRRRRFRNDLKDLQ